MFPRRVLTRGPATRAVNDVSLTVAGGEVVGVMGPNGAGKSTLLEIAAMLVAPSAGTVLVRGCDVRRAPARARALVGYSGAAHGFYGRLSGRQNLELFAALNEIPSLEATARAAEVVAALDLVEAMERRVETWSEGMRQRLSLVRALVARPAVLLFDEPTRSVDAARRASVHRLLRHAVETDSERSVLLVTHSRDEAVAVCDRVCLLERGSVAWIGPAALAPPLRTEPFSAAGAFA